MNKVLFLSLITSSAFSMQLQLDTVNNTDHKMVRFQESPIELRVFNTPKTNKILVEQKSIFVPNRLGSLELYHGKKGFSIRQENNKYEVKKYFTDPMLRNITKDQLKAFLQEGYLAVNQMDDGQYSVKANLRVIGGGPVLGTIMYWVTKSLCYAIAVGGASAVAITTGGAAVGGIAGGVAGGVATASGTAILATAGTTTAIATTAGVVAGGATVTAAVTGAAGIAGGVIAGAGLAGEAALVTASAVTATGSIAGTIAAVESVSVAVGSFFGMLPTP